MNSICVSLVLTPGHYELQNTSSYYSFSHKQTRNNPVSHWAYKENKSWLIHTVINACKIFFKETLLAILFTLYSSYLKSDVMIEMKFMADFIKKRMHIKTW